MDELDDLATYNGDTQNDMWVDFTDHEYTGEVGEYSDSKESQNETSKNVVSDIWYWVNYDDGFGGSLDERYLQAAGTAYYTDPTVDKREGIAYINVDPNLGKTTLTFSNGESNLKGMDEMALSIKDEEGNIYRSKLYNDENGLCFTHEDEDIILKLLKTEKPLGFRIYKQTYAGSLVITFQFPNDNKFNKMLEEIPHRDLSSYK